jgi:hypothetical protein
MYGRAPQFNDIRIRLFMITYPGEMSMRDVYCSDGSLNEDIMRDIFTHPSFTRSWNTFADALTNLATYYLEGEKDAFVRDVGTLYAGLPARFTNPSAILTLIDSGRGTNQTSVYLKKEGLPESWIGTDTDNNVHHWAASFGLGYNTGPLTGILANTIRELLGWDQLNGPADIELGNRASMMGEALANNERADWFDLPHYWQQSFHSLWKMFMSPN